MKVTDKQVINAIQVIREYCEERKECEGCNIDCSEFKKGQSPCYWTIIPFTDEKL
ncbi:MAG: hypothetical protein ACI4D9_10955 [Lachnospiraceae bacterium]